MRVRRVTAGLLSSLVVLLVGTAVIVLVASLADMSATDAFEVVAIGAGTALVGCLVGVLVMQAVRRRSLATQIAVTALVVLVSVALGAWVAAKSMFLNEHDLSTLAVILVAAGTVGVIVALALGRRVGRGSAMLIALARKIGAGELDFDEPPLPVPDELGRLYVELRRRGTSARRVATSARRCSTDRVASSSPGSPMTCERRSRRSVRSPRRSRTAS